MIINVHIQIRDLREIKTRYILKIIGRRSNVYFNND